MKHLYLAVELKISIRLLRLIQLGSNEPFYQSQSIMAAFFFPKFPSRHSIMKVTFLSAYKPPSKPLQRFLEVVCEGNFHFLEEKPKFSYKTYTYTTYNAHFPYFIRV